MYGLKEGPIVVTEDDLESLREILYSHFEGLGVRIPESMVTMKTVEPLVQVMHPEDVIAWFIFWITAIHRLRLKKGEIDLTWGLKPY